MELIQALEQLSLEVKNQKINISNQLTSEASSARFSEHDQLGNVDCHENNWQYPSTGANNQLQEFDDSIETLFAQISDLEHRNPPISQLDGPLRSVIRRTHFQLESRHLEGSMETSQEEESDCSSQRSSCAIGLGDEQDHHLNPMVKDLLKRDLGAITDTVRKISRILAIGNEIEIVYNNLSQSQNYLHNQADNNRGFDLSYITSMCDSFSSLASSEPHIRNLPIILRYKDYCNRLLLLSRGCSGGNKLNSANMTNVNKGDAEVESFEVDEDDDCAFLNCDQRPDANWTENKLYINHYQRSLE